MSSATAAAAPSHHPAAVGPDIIITIKKRHVVTTKSVYTIRGTATNPGGGIPRVSVQTGATMGKRAKGSFLYNVYADDAQLASSITYRVVIIRKKA